MPKEMRSSGSNMQIPIKQQNTSPYKKIISFFDKSPKGKGNSKDFDEIQQKPTKPLKRSKTFKTKAKNVFRVID